jgi:fructose-1,6-bisphosphatase/inositol monophosphatase family enzyme
MAAVIDKGEVAAGIILDPITDDWTLALRGEGSWTERPDGSQSRHRVASPRPLGEMIGLVSWMFLPEPLRSRVLSGVTRTAGAADYRCAAHHYRLLANTHYDFSLYSKLMPWDHAAGWLIHREAGGYSARLDGSDYTPKQSTGGLLLAPDRESWDRLSDALLRGPSQPS